MKKIKSYFVNLPKGVKLIVGINILVYLIGLISLNYFSFDINYYLGIYPTHSDQFRIYQIITCMFTHSYYPIHIILNLIFLLLYSVSFERTFGFKKYILMYLLSGISCGLFYNSSQNSEFEYSTKKLTSMGIDYKKLNEFNIYEYPKETRKIINRYITSNYSGIGASGTVFGFIVSFMFFNLKRIKNIGVLILIGLGVYQIYLNVMTFFPLDYDYLGSSIGHIGGLTFGLLSSIYLYDKKNNLK
jgi:membrane associated rhomboid family serine protease